MNFFYFPAETIRYPARVAPQGFFRIKNSQLCGILDAPAELAALSLRKVGVAFELVRDTILADSFRYACSNNPEVDIRLA